MFVTVPTLHCKQCSVHTTLNGVIYDTIWDANHSNHGVINSPQCTLLHHIFYSVVM